MSKLYKLLESVLNDIENNLIENINAEDLALKYGLSSYLPSVQVSSLDIIPDGFCADSMYKAIKKYFNFFQNLLDR